MNDFMKNASGLTKNPLGIIALFISLIYGFACIVLSTSLSNMTTEEERLPLIWFIILFPIFILLAFIYLVVNHHEKLYSPSDFREDDSFIQALNGRRIKRKQKKEAQILEDAEIVSDSSGENLKEEEEEEEEKEDNQPKTTEEPKSNNYKNPNEITKQLITVNKSEELINKYSNAENWVAKEIGLKYNLSVRTNQVVVTKFGQFELDIIGNDNKKAIIAEVKYWEAKKSIKSLKISIQDFLRNYKRLESVFGVNKEFKIIVAFVFDNLEKTLKDELKQFIKEINENVIVEFYEYDELKREYLE